MSNKGSVIICMEPERANNVLAGLGAAYSLYRAYQRAPTFDPQWWQGPPRRVSRRYMTGKRPYAPSWGGAKGYKRRRIPKRYGRKGYRLRAAKCHGPELQILDSLIPVGVLANGNAAVEWLTPDLDVGSGYNERHGRDVYPHSLSVKMLFSSATIAQVTSTGMKPPPAIEWYIVQDNQVNGASLPGFADIRSTTSEPYPSHSNLNNLKRFKVLKSGLVSWSQQAQYYDSGTADEKMFALTPVNKQVYLKSLECMRYLTTSPSGQSYSDLDRGGLLFVYKIMGMDSTVSNFWRTYLKISLNVRLTFTS